MNIAVIAYCGRAMAVSAARCQMPVHVIDCFADQDTVACARAVQRVPQSGYGFARRELEDAVIQLSGKNKDLILLPCSGFESNPDALARLAALAPCLGNTAETIRQCKSPGEFFTLLAELSIPHPRTSGNIDDIDAPCLIKTIGAMGGGHIRQWTENGAYDPDCEYLQEFISGRAMSVLFIADGERHEIIGFSELFTGAGSFLFSGAVTVPVMSQSLSGRINAYLGALVPRLSLAGLCGADFILNGGGEPVLLEINPRPPATFVLHEDKQALFKAHVDACRGDLPAQQIAGAARYNAMRVLYADDAICIAANIDWPSWSANKPVEGTGIYTGDPVCTVYASANDRSQALARLHQREKMMRDQWSRFGPIAQAAGIEYMEKPL